MRIRLRAIGAAFACLAACFADAQSWPAKTSTVINPFSPGTTTDTVARVVAEELQKKYGTTFIVDSKPGAGGMIGTAQIAHSPADGGSFGVSIAGPLLHNKLLYKKMAYDPVKDLTPLALAVHQPCLLVASKALGVNTVPALVSLLKTNPGKYNYAYVGNGSLGHLVMTLLANKSATEIVPVLYPGAGQAMVAIMSGDVQLGCLPAQGVIGQVQAGTLVPIAVSTERRAESLPQVPALREFYPDIVGSAWIGFVGPAGIAPDVARRISASIGEALRQPRVVHLLKQQFMEVAAGTPEEFTSFLDQERTRWTPVIQSNHITAE